MHLRVLTLLLAFSVVACGGDSKEAPPASADGSPSAALSPDEYRKAQQRYADSVLNTAQTAAAIVGKLGKDYEVGSLALRDSLAALSGKTNCFAKGRESDPYLAGTVSFYVYMSVIGTNVIRVQEDITTWTSAAGNIVNSCLNVEAKKWSFDVSFGKPANYITQVQFK